MATAVLLAAQYSRVYSDADCCFSYRAADGERPVQPLEGMIERGRALVAQEPRDLRQCKTWLFEILEREATAQLVNDRREGRAFTR